MQHDPETGGGNGSASVAQQNNPTIALAVGWLVLALLGPGTALAAEGVPALTSIGLGWFDQDAVGINLLWFDQGSDAGKGETLSLRLEHRPGGELAWQPAPWATLRPWLAGEVTAERAVWAGAGGLVDLHAGPLVFTASLGAGLYHQGAGKDLGYPLEFRSGIEAGWRFGGGWRLSAGYFHMSNSEIRPDDNPGQNTLMLLLHMPGQWLCPR